MFKEITGNDLLTAERKYQSGFEFRPYCRLVFSCNQPPTTPDTSDGFFDRWLVVPFTKSFRGTEAEVPRHQLDAILTAPSELSGLLNKALDGLDRFRANSDHYTVAPSMLGAFAEFRRDSDPIGMWLTLNLVDAPGSIITKSDLVRAYNLWSRSAVTATAVGRSLRGLRPDIKDSQRTVDGLVQWCWNDVGLRPRLGN